MSFDIFEGETVMSEKSNHILFFVMGRFGVLQGVQYISCLGPI